MNNIKSDILWRVILVYSVILLMGLAIIAKLIHIQLVEREGLIVETEEQNLRYFKVEAVRGNIYSDDGNLLVTSVPVFNIRMDVASPLISDTYFEENVGKLATRLSGLFRDKKIWEYERDLRKQRKKGNRYYIIKRRVTYNELKQLRAFPIFERGKYKGGLIAIPGSKRKKPYGLMAERTLGYANETEGIFVGLEGAYSEMLRGTEGQQLKRRINNGDWRPVFDENEIDPQNGKDIITSINIHLQDVAETSLYSHLMEHEAEWGCAVLMEVETGYIKAIANLTRDSLTGEYKEIYNHAVGTSIEPGSTFKLASVLAMIEEGLINLDDSVYVGNGVVRYANLEIKDVHAPEKKWITLREAFEASSNVGISKLVNNLFSEFPSKYTDQLYQLSLNEQLGIDIPGEGKPFLKNTESDDWTGVSLPFMSIGYELMLTPIQLLTFYNAIANDGVRVKPLFVKQIGQAGMIVEERSVEVLNSSICSDETILKMRELLEGVVERGTAKKLKNPYYKVAGKTGTAQIAINGRYDKKNYNASFVGYFPAGNPKYSCIVVVSKPSTGRYYASSVAVPVFKEIADKVYSTNLDIHQHLPDTVDKTDYPVWAIGNRMDLEEIYNTLSIPLDTLSTTADWAVSVISGDAVMLKTRTIPVGSIPNVKGMGLRDAIYVLESMGMDVTVRGRGKVRKQSVEPGKQVRQGDKITIYLEV
ncbi:MAG: transpeptidase family protein [Bacteroidales bacterium]|nr:transpeptidase family protein [Bacteroidales bacterium]